MKVAPTEGQHLWLVKETKQYVTTYIVAADTEKGALTKVQTKGVPNVDVDPGEAVWTAEKYVRAEPE